MAKENIEEIVTLFAMAGNHNLYKGDKLVLDWKKLIDWKNITKFEEQDVVVLVTERVVSEKKDGDKIIFMHYIRRANEKEVKEYWADFLGEGDAYNTMGF